MSRAKDPDRTDLEIVLGAGMLDLSDLRGQTDRGVRWPVPAFE